MSHSYIFSRPLDSTETNFKYLGDIGASTGHEHWAVSVALRLAFPSPVKEPEPFLQRAWIILRHQYPCLGASIVQKPDESATTPVMAIHPVDDSAWVSDTFYTYDDQTTTSDTLYSSFRPTPTATCHWIPRTAELLIHSSHWRLDGIGALLVADRFMVALTTVLRDGLDRPLDLDYLSKNNEAQQEQAEEELHASFDSIAGAYTDDSSIPAHIRAAADGLLMKYLSGLPAIGLPTIAGSEAAAPGPSKCVRITLTPDVTASVVAACKARGLSVNAAVHAAVVAATATFPQHPLAGGKYATLIAADVRRRLSERQRQGRDLVTGVFTSSLCGRVDGLTGETPKGFADIARELTQVYRTDTSRVWVDEESGKSVDLIELAAPLTRRMGALLSAPPPPEMPPVKTPDLSSLGIAEKYVQRQYAVAVGVGAGGEAHHVEVLDMWVGTEFLLRGVQCHSWTFRDRLSLCAAFNTSYYTEDFMASVLALAERQVLEGLGVVVVDEERR